MGAGQIGISGGPAGPTSHTYFSQRLRLHYLDWGNVDAPPLLLVHGNRDHGHNWDWVAERLCGEYHVIAPDLRGHGDSQWSTGSTYGIAEYVYDIAQLIHQQQLAPLKIVGHSLGGIVSLRYTGTYPESVERLVVVEGTGPPAPPIDQRPTPAARMRAWIDNGRSLAGRSPRRYASIDEAYQRMQEANPHLSPEQARHLTIHGANQNEDGTYSWKFDNHVHGGPSLDLSPEDSRAIWGDITCPVLLVTGAESWQGEFIATDDMVGAFDDARHVAIAGAGHWVQHDQLDVFVDLVRDFLAS
jgi:pimeloyl-ACP methyl ester carboxylesterase